MIICWFASNFSIKFACPRYLMSSWSVKVKYEMNISNEDSLLPDFKSVGKSHLVFFFNCWFY